MVDSLLPADVKGCGVFLNGPFEIFAMVQERRAQESWASQSNWLRFSVRAGLLHGWHSCGQENGFAILLCGRCRKAWGVEW
jgi:hypothetical protein